MDAKKFCHLEVVRYFDFLEDVRDGTLERMFPDYENNLPDTEDNWLIVFNQWRERKGYPHFPNRLCPV